MGLLKKAQESASTKQESASTNQDKIEKQVSFMARMNNKEEMQKLIDRLQNIAEQKHESLTVKGDSRILKLKADRIFQNPADSTAKEFFKKYNLKAPYNPVNQNLGAWDFLKRLDIGGWRAYRSNMKLYSKFHDHALHITMELKKGGKKFFWVNEIEDGFLYNAGQYIFDVDMKYEITDIYGRVYYGYDFYEGWPVPFKHLFPHNEIVKAVREGLAGEEVMEVDYATNPFLLLKFILSDIIKKLFASDQILPMLQLAFYILCAVGILTLANTIMDIVILVKIGGIKKVVELMGTNLQNLVNTLSMIIKK